MAFPKSQKSILSVKSLLFTPGTKSDHFDRAAVVHADALIIDLEDAVAPSAKKEAREASLRYLEALSINLSCVLRINAPDTRVGLDDLQALLNSSAEPDYLILPKCDSSATIRSIHNLLRETGKSTKIIALIETAKGVGALDDIVGGTIKNPGAFDSIVATLPKRGTGQTKKAQNNPAFGRAPGLTGLVARSRFVC